MGSSGGISSVSSGAEKKELAYAERTTDFSTTSNADTSTGNVPGLSITFTADGVTPILLEYWGVTAVSSSSNVGIIQVMEGSSNIIVGFARPSILDGTAIGGESPAVLKKRFVPTAGQHTYFVRIRLLNSGDGSLLLDADNSKNAFIRAVEVDVA